MCIIFQNKIKCIYVLTNISFLVVSITGQFNCGEQWAPADPATGCCGQDFSGALRADDLQDLLNKYSYRRSLNASATFEDGIIPSRRISEGTDTQSDQFPWMVYLVLIFDKSAISCSGSLISSKHILTAAHCVRKDGMNLVDIKITAAEYDLNNFPVDCNYGMGNQQCVENILLYPENYVYHSQHNKELLHNDIALIKLRYNAPYTKFIQPICLPPFDIDRPDFANLPLQIAGWGRIHENTEGDGIKLTAVVGLVPNDVCRQDVSYLIRSQMCTVGRAGQDHCRGDSGGPLMLLYRGTYYLVGIISGKNMNTYCGSSVPSFYTNVFQFLPWINMQIGV